MLDPRKLKPSELCQLLNSTLLGEVLDERTLRQHRTRAGLKIGNGKHLDLFRYVAWLVQIRHTPKAKEPDGPDLSIAALGAATIANRKEQAKGHGQKLGAKQEALIAALLTESSHAAAASKVGISEATLYRWLELPEFQAAYRRARRELVESAIGRIQAGTGHAVDALLSIAKQGRRDGDRVRAAIALLNHAGRGLNDAELLHGEPEADNAKGDTGAVVRLLASRLQQIDQSEIPAAEKASLMATLSGALLRAINMDVLDKRMEALEAVLKGRKEQAK